MLRCEDLGVVEKTLELLLIPARKIESQKSLSDKFDNLIDYRIVEVLAACMLPPLIQPSENEGIELKFGYFHARRLESIEDRESVEYVRLLALSIYLLMSSDMPSDVTGFSLNPSLIADTVKLVSATPQSRGQRIEAAALSAVRGFLKFDSKWTETVYALDASASHGPIATIFRNISRCITENSDLPYESNFLAAFFDLTSAMANTAEFDEALVTSTVIDEIVRAFPTTQPRFYKIVEKFMGVIDPLVQYMTEALDAFFAADGLSIAVKHVATLVDLKETEESARKPHLAYLSSLLKFLLKLLTEFGSNDRLRNLIEGSFFKSIKCIFENQSRFNPEVFYYATHILSTFIHTEPTSLSILQECGVPQALLTALTSNPIPAHAELLTILPQAFDAICLNSSGAGSFLEADPLPAFMNFLTSSSYFAQLQANHNAVSKAMAIGNAMDEFMRHHPNLLSIVIPNIVEAIEQLEVLLRRERGIIEADSPIQKVAKDAPSTIESVPFATIQSQEQRRRVDPLHISMLESLCLFVEAIVKTPAHRDAFLEQSGVNKLLACYCAPLLPADFVNSQACLSINHCFHVLAEQEPERVIAPILVTVAKTEQYLQAFLNWSSSQSILMKPLTCSSADWENAAAAVQEITVFGTLLALLADLCFAQHMNFSRSHSKIVPTILEAPQIEEIMLYVGKLMRCCLWEYWALRRELPREWLASACRFSQVPQMKQLKDAETIPVPAEIRVLTGIVDSKELMFANPDDVRIKNLKAALTILRQVPTSVIAFFTGLARTLAARRVISAVMAELSPEEIARGYGLIVRSIDSHEFVQSRVAEDSYLLNRLISASVSLTNLIFVDDSNFKTAILLPAIAVFDAEDSFTSLSGCLERVFASTATNDQDKAFLMISVNDVYESVLGVFSRVAEESLYRPASWEDFGRPGLVVRMFDFMAKWTLRILQTVPDVLPFLSIECIQLLLSTCCSIMLTPNPAQTGVVSVLEDVLRCARRGEPNQHIPEGLVCENIQALAAFLNANLFSLVPQILEKSKDLCYDLAQLLARFPAIGLDIAQIISVSMSQNIALHAKLLAIVFSSTRRVEALKQSISVLDSAFLQPLATAISSTEDSAEKSSMITSYSIVASQLVILADMEVSDLQVPLESAKSAAEASLQFMKFDDLSVDAVHALLLSIFSATRSPLLMPEFGRKMIAENLISVLLKSATRCLDSDDTRHRAIVSLVALILRHLIENKAYLTALFRQEMTARFRAQNGEPLEDLLPFIEPFFMRDRDAAIEAVEATFCVDLMDEALQATGAQATAEAFPTFTLQSILRSYCNRHIGTLKTKNSKLEADKAVTLDHLSVPAESSPAVLDVLKDQNNSPLAASLIDCIIEELLTCKLTKWPGSMDELKEYDNDKAIQQIHFYRCALMLFLSELILAYPVCHRGFMAHAKATKVIEFLLQVMVPYGNVRFSTMNQAYERSWVQYLLINLCMGSIAEEAAISTKNLGLDSLPLSMAESCKFVVGCLMSQLKSECKLIGTSRADEFLIGRLFGLSDTIYCLLTIKTATVGRFAQSMTTHLAALLLENRATHFLSQALQAFDSNNPAYEDITVNIIRTLEALCKFSNRLAKLAARSSAAAGNPKAITDFSMLQDFSNSDDTSESDYGYESLTSDDEDDSGMSSGIVSDEMDTSDEEMTSDFDDDDDDDSGYTSSSDFSSDESDDDDMSGMDSEAGVDLIDEAEQVLDFSDLNGVRGRNTNIGNSGPFELIVEEIGDEDTDDSDGEGQGFPVGSDAESSGREYEFEHHHHHHHHDHSDFDTEDDHDMHDHDHSDDSDDDGNFMDDDDWGNDEVEGFGVRGFNSDELSDFPMMGRRHGHRRGRQDPIQAMIGGMIANSTFAGQARTVSDATAHPLTARPTIDPNTDPLRAHLPLLSAQNVNANQNRPTSIVFSQGRPISVSSSEATSSANKLLVNAETFHFPQAVATNRRWQQDIKFAYGELAWSIGKSSNAQEMIESAVKKVTEPYREFLKLAEDADKKILQATGVSNDLEAQKKMLKNAFMEVFNSVGGQHTSGASTSIEPSSQPSSEFISSQPSSQLISSQSSSQLPSSQLPSRVETPATVVDEGVDVDFLLALPIDVREDALMQHFDERRRANPDARTEFTISQAFLDRLPADLRALYQEMSANEIRDAQMDLDMSGEEDDDDDDDGMEEYEFDFDENDQITQVREFSSRSGRASASRNSTVNSLRLRDIMQQLNATMSSAMPAILGMNDTVEAEPAAPTVPMKVLTPTALQSIPAVDPSSLVSMLRSYYSPVISERRLHHKLFLSLCKNNKTLVELINVLIYVLERMPSDLVTLTAVLDGYVETLTGTSVQPGKSIKRSRSAGGTSTPPLLRSQTPIGSTQGVKAHIPVLQRTLQLLLHLASHNESVCAFFTAPVDTPWTIKRHARSFGSNSSLSSSKTAMTISTRYPIVLILACLERSAFTGSSLLVENLMHLLQVITGPLAKVVNPQDLKSKSLKAEELFNLSLVEIPHYLLTGLVRALVGCEFTPKAFNYASHLFQNFAVLERIAGPLLGDLSEAADVCIPEVIAALKEFMAIESLKAQPQLLKNFSLSTASPARLLRLVRVISALSIAKPTGEALMAAKDEPSKVLAWASEEVVKVVTDRTASWKELDTAISATLKHFEGDLNASANGNGPVTAIQEGSELLQVALLLLPVVEVFFLRHRLLDVLRARRDATALPDTQTLLNFAEEHRIVINSLIRTKPTLLTAGTFLPLTRVPRVLDFDNKRLYFRQRLHKKRPEHLGPSSTMNITVRREHVFEDSFTSIQGKSGDEFKWARLAIKFAGEEGVDAGGVAREWFSVLARQMFNPDYALFRTSAADRITYQPNRMSYINPDHLLYFHFIGRIIGKAIFDGRLLDCYFTRSFYKHILRIPVSLEDLEAVDPELYKSLCWMSDNDITGVMDDLTFTTEADEFGTIRSVELKPDGACINVTEANKREYVRLLTEFKLTTAISPQIDAFLRGFTEIIPADLIGVFTEQELELLISGMPDIDVDDWRANCEYHGGYTLASPQIQWFWRAVRSFDHETRAKLIQFVTGTSKVPLEGFAKLQGSDGIQKFQIHRDPRTKDRLPTAHTCFNQLDLPEYDTYEELRQQLLLSINEGETGFGFI